MNSAKNTKDKLKKILQNLTQNPDKKLLFLIKQFFLFS